MNKDILFEKLHDDAILPTRATAQSAGYDLHAHSPGHGWTIMPGTRMLVRTGVTIKLLPSLELQVRSRSGMALKNGVFVLNSPGTVDADYYPNEIGVILMNLGDEPFHIKKGDRIAQAVISAYYHTDDDAAAGKRMSGFGHTGK